MVDHDQILNKLVKYEDLQNAIQSRDAGCCLYDEPSYLHL